MIARILDITARPVHLDSRSLLLSGIAAILVTASPAFAQTDTTAEAKADGGLDTIVVTANRREENVQKVPISVSAVSGDKMDALNIKRPEDLAKLVPGLAAIPNAGTAVSSFNIRGASQADAAEHEEQPVATYQDGVYVANSASTGFPIYDVQRVEVLRGPQGTLFGRNATAGLIQFISNQPGHDPAGSIEVATGNYNLFRVQGFVNGGSDKIMGRLSFYHSERDGYIKNSAGPNLASENVDAVRAQIAFVPGENTSLKLRFEGWNADGTSDGGKATPTAIGANGYPYFIPANVDVYGTGPGKDLYGFRDTTPIYERAVNDPGLIRKRARTAAATFQHDFDDISLYSVTSYSTAKITYREDTDGSPLLQTRYLDGADSHTFTQELRLQKAVGAFRWTGGLFYFDIDGDYYTTYDLPTFCSPASPGSCTIDRSAGNVPLDPVNGRGAAMRTDYTLHTKSYAVFAQGEYDITDRLTAILGGRYTWDKQNYSYRATCTETITNGCGAIFGVGAVPGIVSGLGLVRLRQNYDDWSGKVGLNYKFTPDIMAYASYSKGLKSAGFSTATDGFVFPDQLRFKAEKLYAAEVGVKSTLLDRKLILNVSAYDYNYKDFQTFIFSGVSFSVVNKDAHARGVELEATLRPLPGLTLNFSGSYNYFMIDGISTPAAPAGEKQHSINSPKWLFNWGVTKDFQVGDLKASLTYNGRYTGDRYYGTVNTPIGHAPSYVIHDANLSIEAGNGLTASVFVNNFTNKKYWSIAFDQTFNGYQIIHYAMPRSYGISLGYSF